MLDGTDAIWVSREYSAHSKWTSSTSPLNYALPQLRGKPVVIGGAGAREGARPHARVQRAGRHRPHLEARASGCIRAR